MQGHDTRHPYCIYEPLPGISGGWSMRGLIGQQLQDRREFVPAPFEDSNAVLARAHAAGEAWCVANGREPANAPSPIDGWVQGMIQTMNGLSNNPAQHSILRKRSF